VKQINIYDDTRDRGLEVLLYHKEKELKTEDNKFKLKFLIPLLFNREFNFQFEFYISHKSKLLEES
jgi:hypothetical protein